jgi:CobQ-like glutamine amidotransferase family enzyme
MRLRLVYLYGDLMNLYGDRGNIITLQRRSAWRGIELGVEEVTVGDRVHPESSDLFFFGGGQDREQEAVSRDLMQGNGDAVCEAIEAGAALLAVCGGYQLLGHYFRTGDGVEIPGVGLFDAFTVAGPTRNVGNVIAQADIDGEVRPLVGFENHSGRTYVGAGQRDATRPTDRVLDASQNSREAVTPTVALARVVVGQGNNGEDRTEGARYRNAVGTYLHGPVLPKNPWLADWLLLAALRRRAGPDATLAPLDDAQELAAHQAIARLVRQRGRVRTSIR